MRKIVGLYSFPKSGNTWMRHILACALGIQELPGTIPDIYKDPLFKNSCRIGCDDTFFYKSHSRKEIKKWSDVKFENDGIVYIMRHPLDVFLSHLNFVSDNVSRDPYILIHCDSVEGVVSREELDLYFGAFIVYGTVQPYFLDAGSWFKNVEFWTNLAAVDSRVVVVKYEDLHSDPVQALLPVSRVIGVPHAQLCGGFERAQAKTQIDGRFFWKQKTENYRDMLPPQMIERFRRYHGKTVEAYGYRLDV